LDLARTLYDPVAHRALAFTYMLEFGVAHSFILAITNFVLGYPERALELAEWSVGLARERQPINLCASLSYGCFILMARGQWALARSWAEEALSTAQKHGFSHAVSHSRVNHGIALVHLDRVKEGLDQIREGIELARPTGYDTWLVNHLVWLADAYVIAGRPEDALDALTEAETLAAKTGGRHCESLLLRARGDVALALDRSSEAEARFRGAIDVARAQDAKSWELHAAIRLARLLRGNGGSAEARDLLAPIHGWFTEGFDTADLKEAKALLDDLS
jgi:predicted ATPase